MEELANRDEGLPAIASASLIDIAEQAEKRIEAIIKIKKVALKVTNKFDWTNQQDRPYLQVSGSEKIANLFSISWRIDEPRMEVEEDGHFTYTFKGVFSLAGRTIEVEGSRSSKDPFFKKYEWKNNVRTELPLSAIDKRDVKMAAMTNLLGNGISRILGIRNLQWSDLQEFAGIKKEDVNEIQYKKGGKEKAPLVEPQKKTNGQTNGQDSEKKDGPFIQTPISDVKVTNGKKGDGTPWSNYRIYGILDGNETAFSTFSETVGKMAQDEKGTGMVMRLEYEKVVKGDKTYLNVTGLSRAEEGPSDDNAQD